MTAHLHLLAKQLTHKIAPIMDIDDAPSNSHFDRGYEFIRTSPERAKCGSKKDHFDLIYANSYPRLCF